MMRRNVVAGLLLLAALPANSQETAPEKPLAADDARVAVIGALDKRHGTSAEFILKPGENFEFGRLRGILRTCETTAPWEQRQSGAFVQIVETPLPRTRRENPQPRTVFSGWLFAESPSLNPMAHPTYDVWLKSCTMHFPDGPASASADGSAKASGVSPSGQARSTTTDGTTN